jgi:hypothetical protein
LESTAGEPGPKAPVTDGVDRPSSEPHLGRHAAWCKADLPEGASQCPSCGLFQPKHTINLVSGLRCERAQLAQLPGQEAIGRAIAVKRDAVYADLGGESSLTEVMKGEVGRYCRLLVLEETLWSNLERCGALTAKGSRRAALSAYLQVNDRIGFVAARIGLQRATKRVDIARVLSGLDRPQP